MNFAKAIVTILHKNLLFEEHLYTFVTHYNVAHLSKPWCLADFLYNFARFLQFLLVSFCSIVLRF